MVEFELPGHVAHVRRDGRREVLLHRSLALISADKVEIKSARGTVILPLLTLVLVAGAGAWIAATGGTLNFWLMVGLLLFCLLAAPISLMSLVSSIAGADVIVDRKKGSATWQQGYLGMGIGTKELVPFANIDHLEVTIEGDKADRWREESDALRQFALVMVKRSGKRLTLTQLPVPVYGQMDGMDRTLAVANAVAAITGTRVVLPEGWELVEVDIATGMPVASDPNQGSNRRKRKSRG
jgi:ABC-type transport system involved in cytochrome bd biosynthesis fused ATPase/permease subunit